MFPDQNEKTFRYEQNGFLGCVCVPDVPRKMLAPRKDHATFAISTALKGLCGRLTIAFERGLLVTVCDDDRRVGGHVVGEGKKRHKCGWGFVVPGLFK